MKITDYQFGHIEINGRRYNTDVIITPDAVKDGWWRREGHSLAIEDLDAVVDAQPDLLIVGSGYYGRMQVPETTRAFLETKGIRLRVETTSEAVHAFNALQEKNARVAAALHLTC